MTVTTFVAAGSTFTVTGVGFDDVGQFERGGVKVDPATVAPLFDALRAGALCNDTRLFGRGAEAKVEGDPTEAALTVAARKAGLDADALAKWPRRDVVPFESQHMFMATLHDFEGGAVLYVKGSSDALLARCVDALGTQLDLAALHREVDALAEQGLRVLVIARRTCPTEQRSITHADVQGLTFVALVGMIDPPRQEAKRAVAACLAAGVKVKMITGDHRVTAAAIASQLGLEGEREGTRLRAVTGQELDALPIEELPGVAERVAVFARVAPEQKLKLVRALQGLGHVVAMTGDGVNDAPALKQADIGVAMGRGGTDVARAASAMILTDDNFATIEAAVEEGRGVYDNLVKFIAWTLPTNGGAGVVLLVAILLGTQLPVLPVQLLWVNMVTAVLLGTALVFEPREPGLMLRPPRPVDSPILTTSLGVRTVLVSVVIGGIAFGCFEWAESLGLSHAAGRTVAVNTIVMAEVGYLFACRSLRFPMWKLGLFTNKWVWLGSGAMLLAQLAYTYLPIMNRLLHTTPLDAWWWGVVFGAGGVVFVLAEAKKGFQRIA
jgi:Ca2+-transporting ATPase